MRYTVILNCPNGVVNRFECPNPDCEEILSVPIGTDDEFRRRIELECTCGSTTHLMGRGIINGGR